MYSLAHFVHALHVHREVINLLLSSWETTCVSVREKLLAVVVNKLAWGCIPGISSNCFDAVWRSAFCPCTVQDLLLCVDTLLLPGSTLRLFLNTEELEAGVFRNL